MEGGAARLAAGEARADRHRLDGVDRHQRLRDPPVEPPVPLGEGAEPRRHAARDHLDDAADACRRPSSRGRSRRSSPPRLRASAQRTGLSSTRVERRPRGPARRRRGRGADADDVAADLGPRLAQQRPGQGARRDARGRLAGARPLEHVAQVVGPVLEGAGEVGVARAAGSAAGGARGRRRAAGSGDITSFQFSWSCCGSGGATGLPSVRPWRTPESTSTASCLDLHAPAAAVAALAAAQVGVDRARARRGRPRAGPRPRRSGRVRAIRPR